MWACTRNPVLHMSTGWAIVSPRSKEFVCHCLSQCRVCAESWPRRPCPEVLLIGRLALAARIYCNASSQCSVWRSPILWRRKIYAPAPSTLSSEASLVRERTYWCVGKTRSSLAAHYIRCRPSPWLAGNACNAPTSWRQVRLCVVWARSQGVIRLCLRFQALSSARGTICLRT